MEKEYLLGLRNPENRARDLELAERAADNSGSSRCSKNGHWIVGVKPYCDCFFGFEGPECSRASQSKDIKAAIVYLMYGEQAYYSIILETVQSLYAQFTSRHPYPVVIFHSANFAEPTAPDSEKTYLDAMRDEYPGPLIFQQVLLEYPPSKMEEYTTNPPTGQPCRGTAINYLHMLRFFSYTIFTYPVLSQFDLCGGWMEISVCFFNSLFGALATSRAVFGYYFFEEGMVASWCQGDHRNLTAAYITANNIQPTWLHKLVPGTEYLGAWGVFKMSFWTSPTVMHFLEYMDSQAPGYRYRFGEQHVFPLTLALLAPPSAVHQYAGLGPFQHRAAEIIWGQREANGFHLMFEDKYCPNPLICDELLNCYEKDTVAEDDVDEADCGSDPTHGKLLENTDYWQAAVHSPPHAHAAATDASSFSVVGIPPERSQDKVDHFVIMAQHCALGSGGAYRLCYKEAAAVSIRLRRCSNRMRNDAAVCASQAVAAVHRATNDMTDQLSLCLKGLTSLIVDTVLYGPLTASPAHFALSFPQLTLVGLQAEVLYG
eukprot:CAMPEP_0114550736 /NCGR_PEP_ID=MMETSP0114-20121206/6227_1 /TAXON_ID=31324 /ORGANISM="Goniomonas sp, Strain m" /LENGTH=542 /DNA_ID=CAMNT_0001735519 /DNA_START=87 /DNA_END=1712 /DNA_ORIENTATION=-